MNKSTECKPVIFRILPSMHQIIKDYCDKHGLKMYAGVTRIMELGLERLKEIEDDQVKHEHD